ncbi:MAG: hypothetical protein L0H64_04590, partial [Pseudonocardia sp.]|nr:hypothetical protein [Pseudonocardia sp.]
ADDLRQRWKRWRPDVAVVMVEGADERGRPSRVLGPAIARYVREHAARGPAEHVIVMVGEVHPDRWFQQVLFNRRGVILARYLAHHTAAVVCRFRFQLLPRRVPRYSDESRVAHR